MKTIITIPCFSRQAIAPIRTRRKNIKNRKSNLVEVIDSSKIAFSPTADLKDTIKVKGKKIE
jgi:hypothetical protein